MSFLLKLDAFRRIPLELTNPTYHGAYLTLFAYSMMALLFFFELHSYLSTTITKTIELDMNYSSNIWIDFDIIMHELPCKYSKVVVRDIVGQQELEVLESRITKERTDVRSGTFKGIHIANNNNNNNNNPNETPHHSHNNNGEWVHPEFEADWISTSDVIKHNDFEAVLKYHDFTLINFYAEWCIHCRRFAPIWVETEKEADAKTYYDRNNNEVIAKLLRINCVEFQQLCGRIGIRAYPTVRMYKSDETFQIYHGERKKENILQYIYDFIKSEEIQTETVSHHSIIEEGCRIHGELKVRRVPGYFLLEADGNTIQDSLEPSMTNVSHLVNHLWFLDNREKLRDYVKNTARHVTQDILSNVQPLKQKEFVIYKSHMAPQHYLNVIPTIFDNKVIVYQSTVQSHITDINEKDIPQARFTYNFSPMQINISTKGRPLYDFLTSIFAIIGGTYTFISLVDRFWDTMSQRYKNNIQKLG